MSNASVQSSHRVDDVLRREPGSAIAEEIGRMASAVLMATGQHWLRGVALAAECGRRLGVEPGSAFQIMTPAGIVTVFIESEVRR